MSQKAAKPKPETQSIVLEMVEEIGEPTLRAKPQSTAAERGEEIVWVNKTDLALEIKFDSRMLCSADARLLVPARDTKPCRIRQDAQRVKHPYSAWNGSQQIGFEGGVEPDIIIR